MEPHFNLILEAVQDPQTPKGRFSADKGVRLGGGREISVRAETLQLFPRNSTELCRRMARQPWNAERDEELNLLSAHGGRWIHGKWPRSQHFSSVAQTCLTLRPPWTVACQGSLSFPISQSLLKLMSVGSVMPSNHLILCRSLFLLPSIFPSIIWAQEPAWMDL